MMSSLLPLTKKAIGAMIVALLLCMLQVAPAFAATGIDTAQARGLNTDKGSSSSGGITVGNFVIEDGLIPSDSEYEVSDDTQSWIMNLNGERVLLAMSAYSNDSNVNFSNASDSQMDSLLSALSESLFENAGVREVNRFSMVNANGVAYRAAFGISSSADVIVMLFYKGTDLMTVMIADHGSSEAFEASNAFAFDLMDAVSLGSSSSSSSSSGTKGFSSFSSSSSSSSSSRAQAYTIGAGVYYIGEDIEPGRYDIVAISGGGNIASWNAAGRLGINEIMGVGKDHYLETYKGLKLESGGELEISGSLVVTLTPR